MVFHVWARLGWSQLNSPIYLSLAGSWTCLFICHLLAVGQADLGGPWLGVVRQLEFLSCGLSSLSRITWLWFHDGEDPNIMGMNKTFWGITSAMALSPSVLIYIVVPPPLHCNYQGGCSLSRIQVPWEMGTLPVSFLTPSTGQTWCPLNVFR